MDKLFIAKGVKKMPKAQEIAQSGHTTSVPQSLPQETNSFSSFANLTRFGETAKRTPT